MTTKSNRPPRLGPSADKEPDPRWNLANERTFLAYERTALGFVVAGLAAGGSYAFADAPVWFAAMGIPFIFLGAALGLEGKRRFVTTQEAMRSGQPLEAPRAVALLPWGIVVVAATGALAVLAQLAAAM